MRYFTIPQTSLLAVLSLSAGLAWAQAPSGNGPPMPPPEALAACKSLASGAACSFTSPHGNLTGTCEAPQGKPLACRPANAPKPGEKPKS